MATAPICIAVQFRRANLVPTASASASCPLILICNKTTNSASSPGREGEGEWFKGRALVLMLMLVLDSRFTFLSSCLPRRSLHGGGSEVEGSPTIFSYSHSRSADCRLKCRSSNDE